MTLSGLELWQHTRPDLLDGCLFWEDCALCEGTGRWPTQPDYPCPNCLEMVSRPFQETGGLHGWPRFALADLAGFHWSALPDPVGRTLKAFANRLDDHLDAGHNLLLTGGVGSGKTHLAVGVGVLAMGLGYTAYATVFADLLLELRASWQPGSRLNEAHILEMLADVDLLILDDLGVERDTPWASERLAHLVNLRYAQQRSILVTSNLTPAQLEQRLDPRVFSRLMDGGLMVELVGVGDFRRMRGPEQSAHSSQLAQVPVSSTRGP